MINWIPTSKRADQCVNTTTYNFVNNTSPYYLDEHFEFAPNSRTDIKNNFSKLTNPFRKTNMMEKIVYCIGPPIWNSLPDSILKVNSLNTFKHIFKKHYLIWIINNVYMYIFVSIFVYVCVSIGVCIYIHMVYVSLLFR